jgi:uncharacterized protein YqgC (DUF456 family)
VEILILITVAILLIVGVIGSVIPVLPGPPISYSAILLLHFFTPYQFDTVLLITLSIFVVVITFLDYWFQFYGVKKNGGGQKATNGTLIGLLVGIFFFPPIGILLGPFTGAYVGAKMEGNDENAIRIAFGSILGFLGGTVLKLLFSGFIFYQSIVLIF